MKGDIQLEQKSSSKYDDEEFLKYMCQRNSKRDLKI